MREMVQDKGPDYRREILEELYISEMESELNESVFIIVEAYVPSETDVTIESVLDGEYFMMRNEAQEKLRMLAADHDIELDSANSFHLHTTAKGIDEQYYYIEELWRG